MAVISGLLAPTGRNLSGPKKKKIPRRRGRQRAGREESLSNLCRVCGRPTLSPRGRRVRQKVAF